MLVIDASRVVEECLFWTSWEMILGMFPYYCWWLKSCTTKDDDYPIIYRVSTIPGGAGFQPSTVAITRIINDYHICTICIGIPKKYLMNSCMADMDRDRSNGWPNGTLPFTAQKNSRFQRTFRSGFDRPQEGKIIFSQSDTPPSISDQQFFFFFNF